MKPIISIIAAVSKNGVIGKDNDIPWNMPTDMKFFKNLTTGHAVIMGRKTFESMGSKPLPNRINVVVTSKLPGDISSDPQVIVFNSMDAAITTITENAPDKNIFIIGGAQMYEEALAREDVNFLILSRIHAVVDGNVMFPEIHRKNWRVVKHTGIYKGVKDQYHFHIKFFVNDMLANRICDEIIEKYGPVNEIYKPMD